MSTESIITAVLAVLAGALLLRRLIRGLGAPCNCGRRMDRFDDLIPSDQDEILSHYRQHEKRTPDTGAIFACQRCKVIHDDFSGVARSMVGDSTSICKVCGQSHVRYIGVPPGGIPVFADANPEHVEEIECLRCQRMPRDCFLCDAKPKVTGCRHCQTLHTWQSGDGQFDYLVALTDKPILQMAHDHTGGLT
ncbi:MAG: hypothetical protein HN712_08105 [Gemmatimonadetes bacterium]|jgi:hypothetical protein|nr:hypothetical protein [Gemmatimonadota bacterium]MBT7860262.1 hypothetical protein [Gemmatimonadota bacterium]